MLLVDAQDGVHANGAARSLLKGLWEGSYRRNVYALIPQAAEDLAAGRIFVAGVRLKG
jgi:hypothetical protein